MPYPLGYFASEGGFTAAPLLFPGSPGTLDESCWRTARLWSLMSEPVVSPEGFTAGPLLLPGLPGIPAPEFCPLGTVAWPPPEGAVVCAEAGSATIASAVAPISNLNMANSLLGVMKGRSPPAPCRNVSVETGPLLAFLGLKLLLLLERDASPVLVTIR
jgi:hypothetical protein